MAILLNLILTILNRLVDALYPRLHFTLGLKGFLLALIAHLPGLLLAVLSVAVLLGLLRASLHFQLTNLLWLEVAVLLLYWEGEDVGELLTIPVNISLAHFHLDLGIINTTENIITDKLLPFVGCCNNPAWVSFCNPSP